MSEFSEFTALQNTDIVLARRPSTGAAGKVQLSTLKPFFGWDIETVVLATSTQDQIVKDKKILFLYAGADFPYLNLANGGLEEGVRVFVFNGTPRGLKINLGTSAKHGEVRYIGLMPGRSVILTAIGDGGEFVPPDPYDDTYAYRLFTLATGLDSDQGPAEVENIASQEYPSAVLAFPSVFVASSQAAVERTNTAYGKMKAFVAPANGIYRLQLSAKCSGASTGSFGIYVNDVQKWTVNLNTTNTLRHWAYQLITGLHAFSVKGGDEISIWGKATSGSITIQGARLIAQRFQRNDLI